MNDLTKVDDETFELESYRLFLDISSACTGYCVAKIQKGRTQNLSDSTCEIVRAGAFWFPKTMNTQQKAYYIYRIITDDFYIVSAITDIVYERFSFNTKQPAGSLVLPQLIGAVMVASQDIPSLPMGVEEIPPQTWRSQCGIKYVTGEDGKRDYKTPTIEHFRKEHGKAIPEKIYSNVTGKERQVPHDCFDALGICEGWHRKMGINKFKIKDGAFNSQLNDGEVLADLGVDDA